MDRQETELIKLQVFIEIRVAKVSRYYAELVLYQHCQCDLILSAESDSPSQKGGDEMSPLLSLLWGASSDQDLSLVR